MPPSEQESGEDPREEWELGLGALLYNVRYDAPEGRRDIWHVVSRWEDYDKGSRLYELWDRSHTERQYYLAEDVLADFEPAGICIMTGFKPRNVLPVDDREYEFDDFFSEA